MQLIVKKLTGKRGEKFLFSNLDFSLFPGQLLLVLGENGTGKSTLLRIIANLYLPEKGEVFLKTNNMNLPVFVFCHYLGDKNAMKPFFTVLENLHFWYSFLNKQTSFQTWYSSFSYSSKKQRPSQNFQSSVCSNYGFSIPENKSRFNFSGNNPAAYSHSLPDIPFPLFYALETMQLTSVRDLPFRMLSAGQKRRAAIARLLVVDRPVWILDEPTTNLDHKAEILFLRLTYHHLARGGIIIIATHHPLDDVMANQTITLTLGR